MEVKSPQPKKLIFMKQSMLRLLRTKNSFFSQDLKTAAGISFYKLSITDVNRSVICSIVPIPSTA